MFFVKLKRILRTGFVNFWRNAFVSLASVLIMVVTLLVIGGVVFSNATFSVFLEHLKDRVDINVYFVTSAPEEDVLRIKESLEALPEVEKVAYTSREEVLLDFKNRHQNDELTLQALEELGDNPLGATLNIKAKETSQYESIVRFLEDSSALSKDGASLVDKINYHQNKVAIDKLTNIIVSGRTIGFAATIFLIAVSILITFNTVRLVIYTSREEISVMRLVGASNTYIRGPFIVTGIMYGIMSAIVTLILFYPITYWMSLKTKSALFGTIDLFDYYATYFGEIFFLLLFSGIAVGAISSYLAIKRYLKI